MKPLYHCANCGRLSTRLASYFRSEDKTYCDTPPCSGTVNNITTAYARLTTRAKQKAANSLAAIRDPKEKRIFLTFQKRAREDFCKATGSMVTSQTRGIP